MTTDAHRGAVAAVERLLNRGGDADDVLRSVVVALHERLPHLETVWIEFAERGQRLVGPSAGGSTEAQAQRFPVHFQGAEVAALAVPATAVRAGDDATLERVATIIAPYCLVGWDTGGERWDP
jgi:hypothetical protein